MKKSGRLSDADACCFDAPLDKTDIVLSLDCVEQSIDSSGEKGRIDLLNGFIGLRTRGGAFVNVPKLIIERIKNDAWQLWNGGSSVDALHINHTAAIHYCDDNHPDVLQAFTKPSGEYDAGDVFDGLYIGYAQCLLDCTDPERSKVNGFLFTEVCQYLNISLFIKGVDFISNSPAPFFLDMTNATNLVVGSAEHPIDRDRVSGKGIRIGARGSKSAAPASKNIVIHAYRGLNVVLEGSALDAAEVVWYEKKNNETTGGVVMADKLKITKMSKAGMRQLIESEKPMPTLYYCEAGVPTIGVGHELTRSQLNSGKIPLSDGSVIDFRNNKALSHEDIMRLLHDDLVSREQVVADLVAVPLDQNNFDALVHFVFNIGRTAFKQSTLLRELNGFDYAAVPGQFKRWKFVTKNGVKVESKGLINRRLIEVGMWHGSTERSDDLNEWADAMAAPAPAPAVHDSMQDQKGIDLVAAAKVLGIHSAEELVSEIKTKTTEGFNETLEQARKQAKVELELKVAEAKADAVNSFRVKNTQKPSQSRTNKSVVAMVVATGLRVLVGTTGLSAVFAEPAVAEMVTGAVVAGLDVAVAGLGVAAIKFRNMATKFIG